MRTGEACYALSEVPAGAADPELGRELRLCVGELLDQSPPLNRRHVGSRLAVRRCRLDRLRRPAVDARQPRLGRLVRLMRVGRADAFQIGRRDLVRVLLELPGELVATRDRGAE
jgi:hypothetical protein